MAQFAAACIKACDRAILWCLWQCYEFGASGHDLGNMFGIVWPVGDDMKDTAWPKFLR